MCLFLLESFNFNLTVASSTLLLMPIDAFVFILSDNVQKNKTRRVSSRGKEKLQYVKNASQRKVTLSRRKSTLFKNAFKLHIMTNAEVFIIAQPTKQHRIVWGSPRLMGDYENGVLKPTVGQELLSPEEAVGYSVEGDQNGPIVVPMTATPEQMDDMSPTLANVLGHVPNTSGMSETTLLTTGFENIPNPVREVLRRRPRARLNFHEMAPLNRVQTEITFVPDENVITAITYINE